MLTSMGMMTEANIDSEVKRMSVSVTSTRYPGIIGTIYTLLPHLNNLQLPNFKCAIALEKSRFYLNLLKVTYFQLK